jgi:hypothetical protein
MVGGSSKVTECKYDKDIIIASLKQEVCSKQSEKMQMQHLLIHDSFLSNCCRRQKRQKTLFMNKRMRRQKNRKEQKILLRQVATKDT